MPGGRLVLCIGCGGTITDQYILRVAPDMEWHASCLKCAACQKHLDEKCTCFVRGGKIFCKHDYTRLFGAKCEKCGTGFTKSNMVMKARNKTYHPDCFRCSSCEKPLRPGEEFSMREGDLVCMKDYYQMKEELADEEMTDDQPDNDSSPFGTDLAEEPELAIEDSASQPSTAESSPCSVVRELRSPSSVGSPADGKRCIVSLSLTRKDHSGRVHKSEGSKKARIRTVLSEKQLTMLKTCYSANPRPDALMKDQLVEMTGLSARVIRVWFQNKRCKDKKRQILMKQVTCLGHDKNSRYGPYGTMAGVPLVASPPLQQEHPGEQFEVTSYQAPWKSLAEFAVTQDLDILNPANPQYQQVIQQMHGYCTDLEAGDQHRMPLAPYGGTPMDDSGGMPMLTQNPYMLHPQSQFCRLSEISTGPNE